MAPITDNNRIRPLETGPIQAPSLRPIPAPAQSDSLIDLDALRIRAHKLGSIAYSGFSTGSARVFGNVEAFVGEQVDAVQTLAESACSSLSHSAQGLLGILENAATTVADSVSHAFQNITDSLLDSLGLREETTALAQNSQPHPALSGNKSSSFLVPTNGRSPSQASEQGTSILESNSSTNDTNPNRSRRAFLPTMNLARSLAAYSNSPSSASEQYPANLRRNTSSPSFYGLVTQSPITSFAQTLVSALASPVHLALSLESYLQAQYDFFPLRLTTLDLPETSRPINTAPSLLSSIPEENNYLHSLVAQTNTALVDFREAIRGERFFVYNSREQRNSERAEQIESRSLTATPLAILSQSIENTEVTAIGRSTTSSGEVVNRNTAEFNSISSNNSSTTIALAIGLAAQQSRVNEPRTSLPYSVMLSSFEGEHARVEASSASLHSQDRSQEDSSNSGNQGSSQQEPENILVAEEQVASRPTSSPLPHGDLQASVFAIA